MQSEMIDGIAYDFFEGEKRQDITLVWVHGTGANKRFMEAVRPALSAFSNVFLDLPGHGDSKGGVFSKNAYVNAIRAVLSRFQNAVLLGHSLGGALILSALAAHPENVIGGVVLNGASAFDQIDPAFYEKIHAGILDMDFVIRGCGHVQHPKVQRALAEIEPDAVAIQDWRIDERIDVRQDLRRIQVPVEILEGGADPFVPAAEIQHLQSAIPNSHVVTIPGGKHMSFLTDDTKLTSCVDRVLIKAGKAEVSTSPILSAVADRVAALLKK
ncbi:alpha/beta fold hydrolase [Pseudoramibacter sp.]|jgi:pimeloyl-ACP methyl ester carboxylesterase|uniref:alpha/beta fold hydrolase n=1 Tax=Pseudoramibacter sp. TaxID=2034862 RepID=UPI0025EEC640|nr:alpha/beta hydrolase [Pseudoramibacter sp.]MCH4072048.1 alpha/beta hydrolase [Pseudoramibacter sp.]MCH4105817.1 alpha/beta hydrolase [Pseudoramibacter sp.]